MTVEIVVRGPDRVGKTAVLRLIMGILRATKISCKLDDVEKFEREELNALKLPEVAARRTSVVLKKETTASGLKTRTNSYYRLRRDQRMIYHNTMGFLTAIDIVLRPRRLLSDAVFPVQGIEYLRIPGDAALAKELEIDFIKADIKWEKVSCITIPQPLELC